MFKVTHFTNCVVSAFNQEYNGFNIVFQTSQEQTYEEPSSSSASDEDTSSEGANWHGTNFNLFGRSPPARPSGAEVSSESER